MLQINQFPGQQANEGLPTIDYATNENLVMNGGAPLSINAFHACNEGIANGFGAMFFNIRDPAFLKTNQPVKQDASLHILLAVMTGIMIICFAIAAAGINKYPRAGTIVLFVVPYVLYLLLGICCSELRQYLHNMKPSAEYVTTYNKMVQGRGFFKFWIECYHYVTVRTKKGTSRRKVVTHTATEVYAVSECFDESGQIGNIFDEKSYIFLHYLKRYYFTDDASQNRFVAAFNGFVHRNTRDCHQNYSHTFDIEGYEEFTGFTPMGGANRTLFTFYLFNFLGMGLPYACLFERFVSRYEIGLLKRLTV
jgi:hypothetical protein